jgi:tetratricopeptide (TPR) repeat protein
MGAGLSALQEGDKLREEGKYRDAIVCYERSIRLDSNNHEAYLNKGITHQLLREKDLAEKCFRKAHELNPKNSLQENMLKDHEMRLTQTEFRSIVLEDGLREVQAQLKFIQESRRWNLDEGGVQAVLSAMKDQLAAHESRITLTEEGYSRLASALNQSKGEVKNFIEQLSELGLEQQDFTEMVSLLRSQVNSLQERISLTENNFEDYSREYNLTTTEFRKLFLALETMNLNQDSLLQNLSHRMSASESKIDGMLLALGVNENEISSLKMMLFQQERELNDDMTRGDLRELVPYVNTLKMIIANQMALEECERISDPYKASLFQTLRRELNATYLASTSVQSEVLNSDLSGKLGKLGKILKAVGGSVPIIGGGVQFLGMVLSQADAMQKTEYVKRYSHIAGSAMEMDEIARNISWMLLDDTFHKSVLDRPRNLLRDIFSRVLNIGRIFFENVVEERGDLQAASVNVMMTEVSSRIAERYESASTQVSSLFKSLRKSHLGEFEREELTLTNMNTDTLLVSNEEDRGEAHGKLLASLIISKIFAGEITTEGRVNRRELAERVVEHIYGHFGFSLDLRRSARDQFQYFESSSPNEFQESILNRDLTTLADLSKEISAQINTQSRNVLSRVLKTSYFDLLVKASESNDLKEELIEELNARLAVLDSAPASGPAFREIMESVIGIMRSRNYHRTDETGMVVFS